MAITIRFTGETSKMSWVAYTEEAFNKVVMNNGIDYNSVMSRSWI